MKILTRKEVMNISKVVEIEKYADKGKCRFNISNEIKRKLRERYPNGVSYVMSYFSQKYIVIINNKWSEIIVKKHIAEEIIDYINKKIEEKLDILGNNIIKHKACKKDVLYINTKDILNNIAESTIEDILMVAKIYEKEEYSYNSLFQKAYQFAYCGLKEDNLVFNFVLLGDFHIKFFRKNGQPYVKFRLIDKNVEILAMSGTRAMVKKVKRLENDIEGFEYEMPAYNMRSVLYKLHNTANNAYKNIRFYGSTVFIEESDMNSWYCASNTQTGLFFNSLTTKRIKDFWDKEKSLTRIELNHKTYSDSGNIYTYNGLIGGDWVSADNITIEEAEKLLSYDKAYGPVTIMLSKITETKDISEEHLNLIEKSVKDTCNALKEYVSKNHMLFKKEFLEKNGINAESKEDIEKAIENIVKSSCLDCGWLYVNVKSNNFTENAITLHICGRKVPNVSENGTIYTGIFNDIDYYQAVTTVAVPLTQIAAKYIKKDLGITIIPSSKLD